MASTVTAAGPSTNTSSSATDSNEKAVCRRGEPASRTLHRVRTIEPSDGMVAPAAVAGMNRTQAGARSWAAATRAAVLTPNAMASGRSTARWPCRSDSRASWGAQNAVPSDPADATAPATP